MAIYPRKVVFRGADDGSRTHTPLFARTDFKSVASTIPPHRRCGVHSKLFIRSVKMDLPTSDNSLSGQGTRCRRSATRLCSQLSKVLEMNQRKLRPGNSGSTIEALRVDSIKKDTEVKKFLGVVRA